MSKKCQQKRDVRLNYIYPDKVFLLLLRGFKELDIPVSKLTLPCFAAIPYQISHYLNRSGVAACTSKTQRQSNVLLHLQISAWLLHYRLLLLQSLLAYPLRCTSTSPPQPNTSLLSHIPPHRPPSSSSLHFLLSQLHSKYSPTRMTPQDNTAFAQFSLGHRIATTKILAPLLAKSPP